MNSGIYALYWGVQDLIYIGLSSRLFFRKEQHLNALKNNTHFNYKVQEAYNNFGEPEYIVIEYAEPSSLPELEKYWVTECDNVLNIAPAGNITGAGTTSIAAKYSKIRILRVFSLLISGILSYTEISAKTGVKSSLIKAIAEGRNHIWLQEIYPSKYEEMLSVDRRAIGNRLQSQIKTSSSVLAHILDTETNEIHAIYNIREFCNNHPSKFNHSNVAKLIKGTYKSYRGLRIV